MNGFDDEAARAYHEAVEAIDAFEAFEAKLTRRRDRGRETTDVEYRKLHDLWEAWDRTQRAWELEGRRTPPGVVGVLRPPPPWEEIEDALGLAPVDDPDKHMRADIAAWDAAGRPTDRDAELTQNKIIKKHRAGRPRFNRLVQELEANQDKPQ